MTQPCKYFKDCKGLAFNRHAKLCGKCWKLYLQTMRLKYPLKKVELKDKLISFTFEELEDEEATRR